MDLDQFLGKYYMYPLTLEFMIRAAGEKIRPRKAGITGGRYCFDLDHFLVCFWMKFESYLWQFRCDLHVLNFRPSGERLVGFQTECAVSSGGGGVARRGHLGVPLGPVWVHFRHTFLVVFLKRRWDGLGLHLGSKNTSTMRPRRGQKSEAESN